MQAHLQPAFDDEQRVGRQRGAQLGQGTHGKHVKAAQKRGWRAPLWHPASIAVEAGGKDSCRILPAFDGTHGRQKVTKGGCGAR